MLKSTLLAGLLITAFNIAPGGVSTAHAAPTAQTASAISPSTPVVGTEKVATVTPPVTPTAVEAQFVALINKERTSRGECALTIDPLLTTTARAHSREMSSLNYFDHHSPTPGLQTPMDRYLKGLHDTCAAVPAYLLVGENIYYCSVFNGHYNVEYGHDALMHSPGHRANILDARFTKIGVGVYQDASGQFWLTQMFMNDQP